MSEQKFLTRKEVAEILRLTPKSVENKSLSGEIGYVKIGRRVLYSQNEIKAYVAKNTRPAKV